MSREEYLDQVNGAESPEAKATVMSLYIATLEKDKAILERALGMMSGRLWLLDNYEDKPDWTYVYDKYIRYGKKEVDEDEKNRDDN